MELQTPEKRRITLILAIVAALTLVNTVAVILLSLPYFGSEDDDPASVAETLPDTFEPTEEPEETLPPPDPNPYDALDFQYENNFLKLIDGVSVTGIDVSSWQYDIDWEQVAAAGVEFAMIRIGYRGYEKGTILPDKYAKANLEGAAAAGLDIGVYFFSQAVTPQEAEEEAYYVLGIIEDYEITMPVVYDWEHVSAENARTKDMDRDTLTRCAKAFLETIDTSGYTAMLYFNKTQSRKLLDLAQLKDYEFWLASYTDRMDFPYEVRMWQYTNKGSVPGIETECDINIYFPNVG